MPERIGRGLWPHPPLKLIDVIEVAADCISKSEWFPRPWKAVEEGKPVYEGAMVQRISPGHFVCHAQRAHPLYSQRVAQIVETAFPTAELAARHFIKWDLHLPGDLDGWKVVDDD